MNLNWSEVKRRLHGLSHYSNAVTVVHTCQYYCWTTYCGL